MTISEKNIDSYIIDQSVITAQKTILFTWTELTDKILAKRPPPYDDPQSVESIVYELGRHIDTHGNRFYKQKNWLVDNGFIEYISGTEGKYLLTEKGKKAKDAGGVTKFIKNEKWDKCISRAKEIVLTFVFPLLTIWFAAQQSCNHTVQITNPIKIIVDSLPKECCIDKNNEKKDTSYTKNDSSNSIKPKR